MIAIIDYGVGNLFSLKSSFHSIGVETVVTGDADRIRMADGVILPGVGAFQDAIGKLKATGLDKAVIAYAGTGKPIMGICLGMQLLFEKSYEYGEFQGLGLIDGQVTPIKDAIPQELKIPHMGWNSLDFVRPDSPLFRHIHNGDYVYFVHSYAATNTDAVIATTEYGAPLTAAVAKKNVFGCQFHPEKSGDVGLRILKAFCELGVK